MLITQRIQCTVELVYDTINKGFLAQCITRNEDVPSEWSNDAGKHMTPEQVIEEAGSLPMTTIKLVQSPDRLVVIDLVNNDFEEYYTQIHDGSKKFNTIEFIKAIMPIFRESDLGLREAKDFADRKLVQVPYSVVTKLQEQHPKLIFRVVG